MFTRVHRIAGLAYVEVLESYRDPATGKPKHRCVARWSDNNFGIGGIQSALKSARLTQRRARADLLRAESRLADVTRALDATAAMIDQRMRVVEHCQQVLTRATKRVEGLIEAEAGLASSGRSVAKPTTTG